MPTFEKETLMENDTSYAFKYGIDIAKDVFQLFRVDPQTLARYGIRSLRKI